jgi:hypothetical protein
MCKGFNELLLPVAMTHFTSRPPNARSNSSPSLDGDMAGGTGAASPSGFRLSRRSVWFCGVPALVGSKIFSSLSSHPGATLRFSANSFSLMLFSHSLIVVAASSLAFWMCLCRPLQEAMMSSGWAAWPLDETTYFGFSDPLGSTATDGGKDDGVLLYVYGRVTAVGNEMKGDTVNGTCASKGWAPRSCQCTEACFHWFKRVYHDCHTSRQWGNGMITVTKTCS